MITAVIMIMYMPCAVFASDISYTYDERIEHLLDHRAELLCQMQYDEVQAVDQKLARPVLYK